MPLNERHREVWEKLERTFFGDVVDDTFSIKGKELADWTEHQDHVVEVIRSLQPNLQARYGHSLVFFRVIEIFRDLHWIQQCVIHGAYHSAIRELRYHLEAMVQAYALWKLHPDAPMNQKLALLPALERRKFRSLLRRSGVEEEALCKLYGDLCKYVHPSSVELTPVIRDGRVDSRFTFCFDEGLFELTRAFTRRTMDALLHLMLLRFEEARKSFGEQEVVLHALRDMGLELTLRTAKGKAAQAPILRMKSRTP